MLFHHELTEDPTAVKSHRIQPAKPLSLNDSYKMFSAVSPSPTRSMIKEANDHLQLLHQKVMELEKTVREQAEALIKKDEFMQVKLREVAEAKDAQINEMKHTLEMYEQRTKHLEQQCREKDVQLETMNQKCVSVEELDVYVPVLEKLVASLKKLPAGTTKQQHAHNNVNNSFILPSMLHVPKGSNRVRKVSRSSGGRTPDRHRDHASNAQMDAAAYHAMDTNDRLISMGASNSTGQAAIADLRIGRSFNINSNFSMSDDDDEEMDKFS